MSDLSAAMMAATNPVETRAKQTPSLAVVHSQGLPISAHPPVIGHPRPCKGTDATARDRVSDLCIRSKQTGTQGQTHPVCEMPDPLCARETWLQGTPVSALPDTGRTYLALPVAFS
jgi:hypothetical protein